MRNTIALLNKTYTFATAIEKTATLRKNEANKRLEKKSKYIWSFKN